MNPKISKFVEQLSKDYPNQFSIGGSTALNMLNIIKSVPNDLDIVVQPSTPLACHIKVCSYIPLLKVGGESGYEKEYPEKYQFDVKFKQFTADGFKIEFFIKEHKNIKYKELVLCHPEVTLEALKSYKRSKDIPKIKLIEEALINLKAFKAFYNQF